MRLILTVSLMLVLAACGGGKGTPGSSSLVVNELVGSGSNEWLELANNSGAEVDLGGFGLADQDKDTGEAKVGDALRFPAGTTLGARGYLLVMLSKSDQAPGPYAADACLPGAASGCFYATFGLSVSRGETVFLLAADNTVLASTPYPSAVAVNPNGTQTACRIPDMTGEFQACAITPGAANSAQ